MLVNGLFASIAAPVRWGCRGPFARGAAEMGVGRGATLQMWEKMPLGLPALCRPGPTTPNSFASRARVSAEACQRLAELPPAATNSPRSHGNAGRSSS